ncbi:hypothetical protein [Roseateles oligotrophus]|uniref:Porin n=1 Tax=Roseateles oligotrophus TaxID=1769250 RepID=A0ABT2YCI9_9BURK|nr:hypothetical protein [Roseateles oligotrophus]MCV2367760.1 hypothetical protein [Roseateles oligotrophus]
MGGRRLGQLLLLACLSGPALADETSRAKDAEAAALQLADLPAAASEPRRDWLLAVEAGLGAATERAGGRDLNTNTERLSLDLQLDRALGAGWRGAFSNQLDLRWQGGFGERSAINTLREAYLSWQPQPDRALDLGRINARHGVALGYNPSDYFRSGAVRSIVAIDPASLKKNRQGSVMLRGQTLWADGSLSALASPKLTEQAASDADFSLNAGATNCSNRWLLLLSQRLAEGINPQWLLFGEEGQSPQLGFNLTGLLGQATVAYVEWSGGRSASQLAQALAAQGAANDQAFRSRYAGGLTYTSADKLSLTLEYNFNGGGMSQAVWRALPHVSAAAYVQYRRWVQDRFDMPTRHVLFAYASWQDALAQPNLDFNAMLRHNLDDHSRLGWVEARYHWPETDLALQYQRNQGGPGSEFGALPQARLLQVLLRRLF